MSEQRYTRKPYKALGVKLKAAREERRQSLAEVSGAVEIDTDVLETFEVGVERPSEDILLLLISHLDLKDDDATSLWELAGYSEDKNDTQSNSYELGQPIAMVIPMDQRIVYTDMVHVAVNNFGVVMNFMQTGGQNGQPLAIARIGMSKDHAQSVLEILQKSLSQSSRPPKMLSQSSESQPKTDKK